VIKFNYINPLISIIICTNNSERTIKDTINSIVIQKYKNYEIIIIDNFSTDNTIKIIKAYKLRKVRIFISSDNGIYNAINKGIKKSYGEIISILHSDDFYYNSSTLFSIIKIFKEKKIDIVYGDLIYVKKHNTKSIIRYWKSDSYKYGSFYKGWSPAHPTFFCKKEKYIKGKFYREDLNNSADIELMYRYLELLKFKSYYLNKILIVMRYGGASNKSIKNIINQNIKIIKFLKIYKNVYKILIFILCKTINRLIQIITAKYNSNDIIK
jgi:glycosyltransferase involved in cell wall biosynthesis